MSSEGLPQRLSDAERDAVVDLLREHFEAGRLEESEFTERMEAALSAKLAAELEPLFADLPNPRPPGLGESGAVPPGIPYPVPGLPMAPWSSALVPRPDAGLPAASPTWVPMARKLVWPVAIVLLIATGSWYWIAIAIVAGMVLRQLDTGQRKPPPYLPPGS